MLETPHRQGLPAGALARDVLAGVIRNRPIIVAPHHARRTWIAYRTAPELSTGSCPGLHEDQCPRIRQAHRRHDLGRALWVDGANGHETPTGRLVTAGSPEATDR